MKALRLFAFADEAARTLSGQIAAMKRNDLAGLEIRGLDTGNVSDLNGAQTKEVRKALEEDLSGLEHTGKEGNVGKYTYPSTDAAFDAACDALKEILKQLKYIADRKSGVQYK